jgi:hypothetical protein
VLIVAVKGVPQLVKAFSTLTVSLVGRSRRIPCANLEDLQHLGRR